MIVDAGQYPITRHLPKTGQATSWWAGDDGQTEYGWWRGRLNANNKTRFLAYTLSGNQVIVDRATGLMWPYDWSGAGGNGGARVLWVAALAWAGALNFAGFTDWRIPNNLELLSVSDYELAGTLVWPVFTGVNITYYYWTSNTDPNNTLNAYIVFEQSGDLARRAKTLTSCVVACRSTRL